MKQLKDKFVSAYSEYKIHNIAQKAENHTSWFVWGYFNQRMRIEIFLNKQEFVCLMLSREGWIMLSYGLLAAAFRRSLIWSSYLCNTEENENFSDKGRAGTRCLRISQGEFRPNVVQVQHKTFSVIRLLWLQGNWKATIELLKIKWWRHVSYFPSCCSISLLISNGLGMEICR